MSELERWRGKVALVTGASSGIGEAIARRLSQLGLHVCVTARAEERVRALCEELGEQATPLAMDVSDERSVKNAFAQIQEKLGGLHVLVNNAGLGFEESLLEGSTERWRQMLEVNILGLCMCTREGVALMRKSEEGHVFHLGSMAGHRIAVGSNVYGATKYAVRALTESLRQELFANNLPIRVTSVSPGFVETNFHAQYFGDENKSAELYSRQKVLEPTDIADAVQYALGTPPHVAVHDVLVRSRHQST